MGEPVRIALVARQMAEQAGRPVEIVYTGLRAGEKLHEELFGADEDDQRPLHPMISHVSVPPLCPVTVSMLAPYEDNDEIITDLAGLCDTAFASRPLIAQQRRASVRQGDIAFRLGG
jgi:FlaA1/EpsC-like NDP-sugar epimerase